MSQLILQGCIEPDGEFRLNGEVHSQGFSGRGSSCFEVTEVLAFAKKLASQTIPRDKPAVLQGGYWDRSGDLLEAHFYIAAYPIDGLDGIGVKVQLCTPPHVHDRCESQHKIEAELQTNYRDLAEFGAQITNLVSGQVALAVLGAQSTPG